MHVISRSYQWLLHLPVAAVPMAAQPCAHPGGHPKQLCVWDESTSEIASCQAPPWGGLPAAVDNRCQGGRESPAPCAHRLPSGQQEGASKAPEMCLRPGQPLTCWGWQPAWGLETWPTKLPSSCLAEAWLGQGAQRLEVEGIQSSSTDAGWRSWLQGTSKDPERAGQLQQRCWSERSLSCNRRRDRKGVTQAAQEEGTGGLWVNSVYRESGVQKRGGLRG